MNGWVLSDVWDPGWHPDYAFPGFPATVILVDIRIGWMLPLVWDPGWYPVGAFPGYPDIAPEILEYEVEIQRVSSQEAEVYMLVVSNVDVSRVFEADSEVYRVLEMEVDL